jgi:hypothetical protein
MMQIIRRREANMKIIEFAAALGELTGEDET